jgi:hypothetical protein
VEVDLTLDHKAIEGARATRRYFAKFERIIGHLGEVAHLSQKQKLLFEEETKVIQGYLNGLGNTFTALSYKFLMANRVGDTAGAQLNIDKRDSGFPVFQELLQMAADALQAKDHLKSLPSQERLKKDMINHILSEQSIPTQLQYALSQRIYYEHLNSSYLFLSQNDPKTVWKGKDMKKRKRNFLVHWAVYDSRTNLPVIYIMDLEDAGSRALPRDERRWPRVQSHLMAQSLSDLSLLTIARGFDRDFNDLHPKLLRRFQLGPMYSHAYTEQFGPLRDVLAEASGEPGSDWALTWQVETLLSEDTTTEKTGIFQTSQREVYKIDTLNPKAVEDGASDITSALIMPHRAFQVLEEKAPPSLKKTRKYVVGKNAKIISYK